jgi:nitroreductase
MASGVSIFDKEQKYNYTEPAAVCDPAAFALVVESRRSVRVYNGDPIPESVMRECLRLALLAPNSSNLQTWEFYWVRDPEKKAALVEACLNQPAAKTAAELVVAVSRHDQWRQRNNQMLGLFNPEKIAKRASAYQYHNVVIPLAYEQGFLEWRGLLKRVGMWLRGLKKPTPRSPKSVSDMRVIGHKSVALACENFMLALRSHGFDSCPMEGFDGVRARAILNLPASAEITMVVSAGRRAENGVYGKRLRFDSAQFIKEV